jgi:hypothetical protein
MHSKGATVEMWAWIAGGIIVAGIIFLIFYKSMVDAACTRMQNEVKTEFDKLYESSRIVCRQGGIGAKEEILVDVGTENCGARAIYVSNTISDVDPK